MDLPGQKHIQWQKWFQGRRTSDTLPQSVQASVIHKDFGRTYSIKEEITTKEVIEKCVQKLNEAIDQRDSWKGNKKQTKSLQRFLVSFSKCLDQYSGIIEILKLVDNRFGAIAYSTLSMFLKTAVNKRNIEERIQDEMEALQRDCPRVQRAYELDPTEKIAHHIDGLYSNILIFARGCIVYFTCNPYKRLEYAFLNRLPKSIDEAVKEIHIHLIECERESNMISRERLRNVERQSAENTNAIHQAELNSIFHLFKSTLVNRDETDFYFKALEDPLGSPKHYRRFSFDLLLSQPSYIRWKETNQSSVLILRGETIAKRDGHSWLSPSVSGLLKDLEDCAPLYYFVQTDPWRHSAPPAHLVVTNIIWQLLKSNPKILTEPGVKIDIEQDMQHKCWQAKKPQIPCKILTKLLGFSPNTYILIDRMDRCSCSFDTLLPILLDMVNDVTSVVKMFIVVDDDGSNLEQLVDSHGRLEIITLHQTQLKVPF